MYFKYLAYWIYRICGTFIILNSEFIIRSITFSNSYNKEAAVRGLGLRLEEGLKIEAGKFLDSIFEPETMEGMEKSMKRDHPDRKYDGEAKTPRIVRSKK